MNVNVRFGFLYVFVDSLYWYMHDRNTCMSTFVAKSYMLYWAVCCLFHDVTGSRFVSLLFIQSFFFMFVFLFYFPFALAMPLVVSVAPSCVSRAPITRSCATTNFEQSTHTHTSEKNREKMYKNYPIHRHCVLWCCCFANTRHTHRMWIKIYHREYRSIRLSNVGNNGQYGEHGQYDRFIIQ